MSEGREEVGPGAGRTAQPDTAVVTERIAALDRHMTSELASLRREMLSGQKEAKEAVSIAAAGQKETLQAHNGLIEKMEDLSTTFATREAMEDFKGTVDTRFRFIERVVWMAAGMALLASFIGAANLVKILTG